MTRSIPHDDTLSYVYLLIDPRDNTPFYVGKTFDPDNRIIGHIADGRKCRIIGNKTKPSIIKGILADGYEPVMRIIEVTTEKYVFEREFTWWQGFVKRGYNICNVVAYGRNYSAEKANLPDVEPHKLSRDDYSFMHKPVSELTSEDRLQMLEALQSRSDRRRVVMMLLALTEDQSEWPEIKRAGKSYINAGRLP